MGASLGLMGASLVLVREWCRVNADGSHPDAGTTSESVIGCVLGFISYFLFHQTSAAECASLDF